MSALEMRKTAVPREISRITDAIQAAGYEAHLVGGCVRDILRGIKPRDWDVTTNALPEQILGLFKHAFYENEFGTVGVVNEEVEDKTLEVVEVTTYRLEATYSDSRHPDQVDFSDKLEDDLKRRDFTINAIAFDVSRETIIDPFCGIKDIKAKIIRAVGDANERFQEDALRMMRAVRLAVELDFTISHETSEAIFKKSPILGRIAEERVRDEFIRILESPRAMQGVSLLQKLGLLPFVAPQLEAGIGIKQNQAHAFDVWEHNLRTMQHAVEKGWPLDVRLAGLFHDAAKPQTRSWSPEKGDWTFYGHDVVGERVTHEALTALKFPKKRIERIAKLVRWHMFFSDPEKITLATVRRLMRNVGEENVRDLVHLRMCDRIGTGRPKEQPYRLRKYQAMIEEASRSPVSVGMLAINGNDLMTSLNLEAGPKIGYILHALLEEILDDPAKNTKAWLEKKASELAMLDEEELKQLGKTGKEKKEGLEQEEIQKIRGKYWVK